jgi:hypothetical protein
LTTISLNISRNSLWVETVDSMSVLRKRWD